MNEEQLVWASDQEKGFILARIVDIAKDKLTLETIARPREGLGCTIFKESYNNVFLADRELEKHVDDNCCLIYLNPGTLLHNIHTRYYKDLIYTYVSNILIALNPYFDIPFLYSEETIKSYIGKSLGKNHPHAFAMAEKAYRDMKTFQKNQSIIISGESGSGKTECIKHLIKYLTHAYGNMKGTIEQRIMDSNPILEAFGNAKTTRNNNSSRFGKFVEIYFDDKYFVSGGLISHYLLEKSRTCSHGKNDRNYHIFYQLCIGADQILREALKIGNISDYKILQQEKINYFLSPNSLQHLNQRSPTILQNLQKHGVNNYENGDILVDDYSDFFKTDQCLTEIGLSKDERQAIYGVVAAILHLGNLKFHDNPEDPKGGCDISPDSAHNLQWVATLLGLDFEDLQRSLTYRMIASKSSKGTVIQIPLKVGESSNLRDSLAKTIYSKLFDHVCYKVNESIPFASSKRYIGILDIAGFEFFVDNGFEQFCINYCNEKMQYYFNHVVLQQEQEIYKQEGLRVKRIQFYDDCDVINLLEAKSTGILYVLDEENKLTLPNATHFTETVHQMHASNAKLSVPRKSMLKAHKTMLDQEGFVIKHYAGAVCYNTKQFIEKNNDALHFSLNLLLQESQNSLVKRLFSDTLEDKGESPKSKGSNAHFKKYRNDSNSNPVKGKLIFQSISGKFREQLKSLIEKFTESNTSFIKCIKPNSSMEKHVFEGRSTLNQLESCGTMELLKLMEHGFPSRISINDLYGRYKHLLPPDLARLDVRLFFQCLFKSIGLSNDDFMFGSSKIFFKSGKFAEFDEIVKNDCQSLNQIIHRLKKWIVKSRWNRVQWCALCVIKLKNKMAWRRENYIVIQKNIRMHLSKVKYKHRYQALLGLKRLQNQTDQMVNLVEKLGRNKESCLAKLSDLRDVTAVTLHQIKSEVLVDAKEINERTENLNQQLKNFINTINVLLAEQCKEQEAKRLKEIQHQIEVEKLLRIEKEREKEEEKKKKDAERSHISSNQPVKYVSQNLNADLENSMKNTALLSNSTDSLDKEIVERQEKRDMDLAIRLSQPIEIAGKTSPEHSFSNKNTVPEKYSLSSWKYIELRDTINTSCDLELLEACREEFHRRLKVYHEWKTKNKRSKTNQNSSSSDAFNDVTRIPSQLINYPNHINQNGALKNEIPIQAKNTQQRHRYYRVPFWQNNSSLGIYCNKGWWYAHFLGNWVVRQMELYEGKEPLLLSAGKDDMQMCELSLDETGLKNKLGAEIVPQEFDILWSKLGGTPFKY